MAGWEDVGALFGLPASNELSYQKGLALGANTQAAMQLARQRVRENTAIDKLTGLAGELGLTPGLVTALQAGIDPRQITGAAGELQERKFRDIAGNPTTTPEAANIALRGVASAPVERYYSVGSKGYADKYADTGVTALPFAASGDHGDAAAIQVLRAFGFLDDAGHVVPGKEQQAFDVMRTTQRTIDEGGVPGVVDANPFRHQPAAPGTGLGAELAPPAPTAAVKPAPAVAPPAAAVPPVTAAPAPAVQPLSSAAQVGANTAEIERQKVIGKAAGEAQAGLPKAQATFANQMSNADTVMGFIDQALKKVDWTTAGPVGKVLGFVPGTPAYDFKKEVARIQANAGFKELATMRHESPTGGALGNVTERELEFLQSTMGNLEQAQGPTQLAEMLQDIRDSYGRFKKSLARDMAAAQTTAAQTGAAPAPTAAPAAAVSLDDYLKSKGF